MTQASAEEFYGQCLASARVLDEAARRWASSGDAVSALACAWGADAYAAQGVIWERVLGAAAAPRRQMYRASEALFAGMRAVTAEGGPLDDAVTCADVVRAARVRLLAQCDDALAEAIRSEWVDLDVLGTLTAPTESEVAAAVSRRLGGASAHVFVSARRAESEAAMGRALAQRVRGEEVAALQEAYEADFLALEGYLVESATAAGDSALFTVIVRWELVTAAITALGGVPEGFVAGVTSIRRALASALADADAQRLLAALPAID